MTTPDSVALPDELRVPMDELEADAGYLMGRAAADPHCADAMAESVRVKIRAIRAEVERLAQSAPLAQQAREYPPQKYDDVLQPFMFLMRKELNANSRKGDRPGWLAMDANTALLEVYWHVAKLSAAVKNNDGPAIMEHSADVANMAMMVLDVCGGLVQVDADRAAAQVDQPAGRVIPADGEVRS